MVEGLSCIRRQGGDDEEEQETGEGETRHSKTSCDIIHVGISFYHRCAYNLSCRLYKLYESQLTCKYVSRHMNSQDISGVWQLMSLEKSVLFDCYLLFLSQHTNCVYILKVVNSILLIVHAMCHLCLSIVFYLVYSQQISIQTFLHVIIPNLLFY